MNGKLTEKSSVLSPSLRITLGTLFVMGVLFMLAGASSIPFIFDSPSIRYKFGMDKLFLRTGKIMGICAGMLLLIQLLLTARFKLLDRVFALNQLYIIHRVNAVVIAVLALLHPLFVFAPEDINNIPVELKYWPEVAGAFLLVLIWLMMASGLWRLFLDFSFDRWWIFHRAAAFTAVTALIIHVLYVSESFEKGVPRTLVLGAAVLYVLILGWIKAKPFLLKRKPYRIANVDKAGKDAYSVEAVPQKGKVSSYLPGQFAFITINSDSLSAEEHPFSISSSPSRPGSLIFTIKCSGDWTNRIGHLKNGDTVCIDGPYGRFSHLTLEQNRELIMIAGGIGITPMLSMLRYMADHNDRRRITLVWSNRTIEEIVYPDEFNELEKKLEGLTIIHILTRSTPAEKRAQRLDRKTIERLLADTDRTSAVFICGPPVMMRDVQREIVNAGFQASSIYTEKFSI